MVGAGEKTRSAEAKSELNGRTQQVTGLVAAVTVFLGQWDGFLRGVFLSLALSFLAYFAARLYEGNLSSRGVAQRVLAQFGYLLLVASGHLLDMTLFAGAPYARNLFCAYTIATNIVLLAEELQVMAVILPAPVLSALKRFLAQIDTEPSPQGQERQGKEK